MTINTNAENALVDQRATSIPRNSTQLTIICILLTAILAINIFQMVTTFQQNKIAEERAASYKQRVLEAEELVTSQQKIIMGLLTDYEKSAYDNPGIDRIAEQQLLAEEYNLTALQILAIQNSQIIELLANAP